MFAGDLLLDLHCTDPPNLLDHRHLTLPKMSANQHTPLKVLPPNVSAESSTPAPSATGHIAESPEVGVEATTLPPINSKNQVIEAADDMFNHMQTYITSEIDLTLDDYKLLESMNNATVEKYHEMRQVASNMADGITELNAKYEQMMPKLEIIDKLDRKVTHLEKLAYAIDAYSKRLEKQYKMLEKKITNPGSVMDGSSL